MRDKKRIGKILETLERIWLKEPDTRFGQLIYNVFRFTDGEPKEITFNTEDDVTEKKLLKFEEMTNTL